MKRAGKIMMLTGLLLAILTGCIQARFYIRINTNGTADVEYKLGLKESSFLALVPKEQDPLQEAAEEARKAGFTVSQYKEEGYTGFIARKHVKNLRDMQKVLPTGLIYTRRAGNSDQKLHVEVEETFLYKTYRLEGQVDLENIFLEDPYSDELSKQIIQRMLSTSEVDLVISLPVKPMADNATSRDASNKTLTWSLIMGKKNDILLVLRVWNVYNVAGIAIGLVLLAVTVFLQFAGKGTKARKDSR
ncbi:MAG: LppM family (lipo)protein [Clostridia bacterium]